MRRDGSIAACRPSSHYAEAVIGRLSPNLWAGRLTRVEDCALHATNDPTETRDGAPVRQRVEFKGRVSLK